MYCCVHIDQLPAQAIEAYCPEYRGQAFVVTRQDSVSYKSEAWASSPEALRRGIEPGMGLRALRKTHPDLYLVSERKDLEQTFREDMTLLAEEMTPVFDIAGSMCVMNLFGIPLLKKLGPVVIDGRLRDMIRERIGIRTIAVGLSRNRLLSRLLAISAAPDGTEICPPFEEDAMLAELDAELIPDLTDTVREKLRKYGLKRIGHIKRLGRQALVCRLGAEGELVYSLASGFDARYAPRTHQAFWSETVMEQDINDQDHLHKMVRLTADKLCHKLRARHRQTDRLSFVLIYTDGRSTQKTEKFSMPTHHYPKLGRKAEEMFEKLYVRRVGVRCVRLGTRLTRPDSGQINLFESIHDRQQEMRERAVTAVRSRMGFEKVVNGDYMDVL